MHDKHEPSDAELAELKKRLKAGKLEGNDLKILESLVERTEQATRKLRAAVVE
jgi:hypothetical protein